MGLISRNFNIIILIILCFIFKSFSLDPLENEQELPIIKLALNSQNIGEIEKIIISKFLSEKEFILPQVNISEDVNFIGNIKLFLNNISMTIANNTEADLYFLEEDNLNAIIHKLQGKILFNYFFISNFINSEGNGTISITNMKLKINNTLVQVQNSHEPEKYITGLNINSIAIDDIDLEFYFSKNGTFEKLMKYINNNLKNLLMKVMEIELNKNLTNINKKLEETFSNIDMNMPIKMEGIDEDLKLSVSMKEKPIIKNNFLELSFEGVIKGEHYDYDEINNISLPCIVNNTDLITNKTINSIISQFIINNALDVLYFFGKLNAEITNDTVGISELSVGMLSGFIREFSYNTSGYRASQKAKIITNALSSPKLNINNNNSIILQLNENLSFFVYNETTYSNESIGTIPIIAESILEINANFNLNEKDIQLKINSIQMLSFDVKKSLIGEIDNGRVISQFNNLIAIYYQSINNQIKNMTDELKQKLINYEGINFSDIYAKSYEDYIKVDISPVLVSLFNLIYY